MDLEYRVETLERDRTALEWMVVYLAKKTLMREMDPVAAAVAMQQEIEGIGQDLFHYSLQKEQETGDKDTTTRMLNLSSGISVLAERIVEDVKLDLGVD